MKFALIFSVLVSFGVAAPRATLDAADAVRNATLAEVPKSPGTKKDQERVVRIGVDLERIRRVEKDIEIKWSFSRRAATGRDIVEANRASTLSDLRILNESAASLRTGIREFVADSKWEQIEVLFASLITAIAEYEKELQTGLYP